MRGLVLCCFARLGQLGQNAAEGFPQEGDPRLASCDGFQTEADTASNAATALAPAVGVTLAK